MTNKKMEIYEKEYKKYFGPYNDMLHEEWGTLAIISEDDFINTLEENGAFLEGAVYDTCRWLHSIGVIVY